MAKETKGKKEQDGKSVTKKREGYGKKKQRKRR